MKGYAAIECFNKRELELRDRAAVIVDAFPDRMPPIGPSDNDWVRCHEVARVVGRLLGLRFDDGKYGSCEHSWCWTSQTTILDTYSIGRHPLVQLVDTSGLLVPETRLYVSGPDRKDTRLDVVERLIVRGAAALMAYERRTAGRQGVG